MSHTHFLTKRLVVSAPLLWICFGRSLRSCHLEFDKEAISDGFMAHSCIFNGGRVWILSDYRELSFRGPCGHCFESVYTELVKI